MKATKVEFETTLTLVDTETECVEVDVKVEANYTAEQPMVRYYADGSGDPGSPAEVEVLRIVRKDNGEEIYFDDLPEKLQTEIEEKTCDVVADRDSDVPEPEAPSPEDLACRVEYYADTMGDR